jgi:hypothetical protein
VDSARRESDEYLIVVDRRENERVEGVRTRPIGVVNEEHVAGLHGIYAEKLN